MKLFDDLKNAKAKYDARLDELLNEMEQLTERLSSLQNEYVAGLEKDALGITPFTDERKIEKAIDETRQEIVKLNEKIDVVKRGKKQAMVNQLPFVKEFAERKRQEVDHEWDDAIEQVQRVKAEFLLAIAALADVAKKADAIKAEHNAFIDETADPSLEEWQVDRMKLRSYKDVGSMPFDPDPIYGDALKRALSVPGWAAKNAYNGNLPTWVLHYATTGEIKFD